VSAYSDHEIGRELVAALYRTHARAEEALLEAYALQERGFRPMRMRGLDRTLPKRDPLTQRGSHGDVA
jgi:hypothetical protein